MRTLIEAGFRYVIFIVMPGDVETLRVLAEQVLPAVSTTSSLEPLPSAA